MSKSLVKCNDTRYNCGPLTPSACVPYTGELPAFVDPSEFPCDVNINDIFKAIQDTLNTLLQGVDLTGLNKQCLTFDPATITVAGLHQVEITTLCALQAQITALQTIINNLNIATQPITIDLQCLTPQVNPCSQSTNVYTLFFILSTMLTKLCNHETRITNLENA